MRKSEPLYFQQITRENIALPPTGINLLLPIVIYYPRLKPGDSYQTEMEHLRQPCPWQRFEFMMSPYSSLLHGGKWLFELNDLVSLMNSKPSCLRSAISNVLGRIIRLRPLASRLPIKQKYRWSMARKLSCIKKSTRLI